MDRMGKIGRVAAGGALAGMLLMAATVWAAAPSAASLAEMSMQELNGRPAGLTLRSGKKDIRLSDYRGSVLMVHFWARCSACMKEMPTLEAMYRRFNGKGLKFLAVNTEGLSNREAVEAMAKRLGVTFPVYFAAEGDVPESYWAAGEPQTYFIDAKGNLIARAFGPRDWSSKEASAFISGLLKGNARK